MRLGYLPQPGEAPYADEDQADAYRRGVMVGHSFGVHDARAERPATPTVAAITRDVLGGFFTMLGGTAVVLWVVRSLAVGPTLQALAAALWAVFVLWLWLWKD
jgi:hypothetical protein